MSDADSQLAAAVMSEAELANQAAEIRGDATELTETLFLALYPLLCKPIPQGFIKHVGVLKGKPYPSTGIRSLQVQINRLNNVLTPLWWWVERSFEHDGKVAHVSVHIGPDRGHTFASGESSGGVDRGSTLGNTYKGSFTNAAKLAIARLGVGNEVYLGATDFDPDVDQAAAEQGDPGTVDPSRVGASIAKALVDRAWKTEQAKARFQLAASHAADRDVGLCGTKQAAVKAVASMTFPQVEQLDRWVTKKEGGGDE